MLILLITHPPPKPPLFPYTTLFRSSRRAQAVAADSGRALHVAGVIARRHVNVVIVLEVALLAVAQRDARSEEHTSELQSRFDLVCRLLLEKKNYIIKMDDMQLL